MEVEPGAVIAKLQQRCGQLELEVAVRDVAIDDLNLRLNAYLQTDLTAKTGTNGHLHFENRDPLLPQGFGE